MSENPQVPIDWKKILEGIGRVGTDHLHEPEAKKVSIGGIRSYVEDGVWLIPDFQRDYDWKPDDVHKLLVSIFMGYYIGSFLLWDPSEDSKLETRAIRGARKPDNDSGSLTVLDGQQRITSINYAINPPRAKPDEGFPGYYYIDFKRYFEGGEPDELVVAKKEKISMEDTVEKMWFPFYCLNNGGINEWMKIFIKKHKLTDDTHNVSVAIRDKLLEILDKFCVPYIVLSKTIKLEVVATVFEKLNSTGMSLGTFDLLNARLSLHKVPMRKLWEDTLAEHGKIREYFEGGMSKINLYIIEAMSLAFSEHKSCKRGDILNLFKTGGYTPDSFTREWIMMSKYVEYAIEHLEDKDNGFGARSRRDLPYEPVIPVIAALLCGIYEDGLPRNPCLRKLARWYWTSVFGVRFSAGVDAKKSSDYKSMMEWFKNDTIPEYIQEFKKRYADINLVSIRRRGSIYLGIFSLLHKNGAIDIAKQIILEKEDFHMDHIFPKSRFQDDGIQDSVSNMTYLTGRTNSRKSAKRPSEYVPRVIQEVYGGSRAEFLKAAMHHFIDEACVGHMENDRFKDFVEARSNLLIKEIGRVIGAE